MTLCVACSIVLTMNKTLISKDDHQKLELRDKLCKLIVVIRPGRFWNIQIFLNLSMMSRLLFYASIYKTPTTPGIITLSFPCLQSKASIPMIGIMMVSKEGERDRATKWLNCSRRRLVPRSPESRSTYSTLKKKKKKNTDSPAAEFHSGYRNRKQPNSASTMDL